MEGQHIPYIDTIRSNINGVTNARKLLQKLKPHKASRPDKIATNLSTYLFKETSNKMSPILTFIFQASVQQTLHFLIGKSKYRIAL